MGLIKAGLGALGGALADQWLEFFYCEAMPADVLVTKGQRREDKRSSNKKGTDNIISSGSGIAVADGQCMIIVEQGKVLDVCFEPGEYTYDVGGEPSLFAGGSMKENIIGSLYAVWERFKFGGQPGKDQRIYYFNTKEIVGNKYGTPSPVPFRVVDTNVGLDLDIAIRCFGEYSYKLMNPILFYANVCGNVEQDYKRSQIDEQMKSELLTALQPAFAKISAMGIRYSALPGHTTEMADALNEVMSAKWRDLRGIEIVSFGVSSVKASEEDEKMIKEIQRNAAFRDPNMAAAHLVGAQAQAMQNAAANEGAGSAMAFVGMNMANQAGGMNAQNLYQMGQQQGQPQYQTPPQAPDGGFGMAAPPPPPQQQAPPPQQQAPPPQQQAAPPPPAAPAQWTCQCGTVNTGNFCSHCAAPKPAPAAPAPWTCRCGTVNTGNFCSNCAAPKPV